MISETKQKIINKIKEILEKQEEEQKQAGKSLFQNIIVNDNTIILVLSQPISKTEIEGLTNFISELLIKKLYNEVSSQELKTLPTLIFSELCENNICSKLKIEI